MKIPASRSYCAYTSAAPRGQLIGAARPLGFISASFPLSATLQARISSRWRSAAGTYEVAAAAASSKPTANLSDAHLYVFSSCCCCGSAEADSECAFRACAEARSDLCQHTRPLVRCSLETFYALRLIVCVYTHSFTQSLSYPRFHGSLRFSRFIDFPSNYNNELLVTLFTSIYISDYTCIL